MISPFFVFWKNKRREKNTNLDQYFEKKAELNLKLKLTEKIEEKTMTNKKEITVDSIKELRDQTGVSIMQCKKALEEAGGDFAKALVILRNKSGELAAKKSDRTFRSGTIQAYIHSNGMVGSMVELLCESDFVANNDEFKNLARDIAMHITATNPRFLSKESITEEDKNTAKEVFEKEIGNKPEAVKAKILEGKMTAYFSEMVLMDQPFIKNSDMIIQALINTAVQKFGEKMAVGRFMRFKVLE